MPELKQPDPLNTLKLKPINSNELKTSSLNILITSMRFSPPMTQTNSILYWTTHK